MNHQPLATPAQKAALVGFLARRGKAAYWQVKDAVGVPRERTLNQLSKWEASRLIEFTKSWEGRR